MKFTLAVLVFVVYLSPTAAATCQDEPKLNGTETIVRLLKFSEKRLSETAISIKAKSAGASWQTQGSEAPVLTVFVDGKYNQDVILFAGPREFDYKILLGRLGTGDHQIILVLNKNRSAPNARLVEIISATVHSYEFDPSSNPPETIAIAHSPFIYARPAAVDKFSDIPLITYYEIFPEAENSFRIRYTTIFSNEDGGTQTRALMARWGRSTDIEWVYELSLKDGKLNSQTFQAANHETKNFVGRRDFGNHPLVYAVTENNNFADAGCSALRVAPFPIRADLSAKSRETVMDENPWTYRIMAEEATREGRVDPKNMGVNTIDALWNYLYVEVFAENDSSAVAVEVRTLDGKTSRSDLGDERLRVGRSGYQRIAVRLPSTVSPLHSIKLYCHAGAGNAVSGDCRNSKITAFLELKESFLLLKTETKMDSKSLRSGENIMWLSPAKH